MKIKMKARRLWTAIDPGGVEPHKNNMALDALTSAVPAEMASTLLGKETTRDAWDSIRTARIGDELVRKSTAQTVRREYEKLDFCDGESVEDFALRLTAIVSRLEILGDPEPPHKVVEKYLRCTKPRFKQLVLSIETLLSISTMYVEEVTGWLAAAEEDQPLQTPSANNDGKLLLSPGCSRGFRSAAAALGRRRPRIQACDARTDKT